MSAILSRAEASPLSWDQLTDPQRSAVRGIAELFGELAQRPWKLPERGGLFGHFLPRIDAQRSNHVALIGGERGMGKTAVLLTLLQIWSERERGEHAAARKETPDGVFRGRVVPVGLVDLQPLPEGTNLLVHLAGQLSRLVDAISDQSMTSRPAWNPNGPAESASRKQWRAFVQAAAAGWEGRLDRRRASLDPEAFALEFEEVERHRLDVPERFRELCDALVDEYPKIFRGDGPPFFVISIDDADMNPKRVLELLDLVRTLWHPRVGFVVTGNRALFLDTLKKQLGVENQDKLPEAIYNKAIPIYQRFTLDALPLSARRHIAKQTLVKTKLFDHPLKPAHLFDYLEINRLASAILPDNMRELSDFQVRLGRYGIDYRQPWWRFSYDRMLQATVMMTIRLQGPDVSDLEVAGEVIPNDGYGGRMLHSSLSYQMIFLDAQNVDQRQRLAVFLGRTVHQGIQFDWPCPRWHTWLDYCALLTLLRKAFGLQVSNEADNDGEEILPDWRYGECTKPTNRDKAFRTYVDCTLRFMEFRRERMHAPESSLSSALDTLAQATASEPPSWDELFQRLDAVAEDLERPREEREWATQHVTLLAAPEHGLSPFIANRMLARLKERYSGNWTDMRVTLRELRLEGAQKPKDREYGREEKGPEPRAVIEQIDARSSVYQWVSDVSRIEIPKDELIRLFTEFPNTKVVPQPLTLAFYFSSERWGILSRNLSGSLRERWMDRIRRLPRGGDSALIAAFVLWNQTAEANALHQNPLRAEPTAEEFQKRYELLGPGAWGFQKQQEIIEIGNMRLTRAVLAWREDTQFEGNLDGVLFEVLWDVVMDAHDQRLPGSGLCEWWQPIGTRTAGSKLSYPWPIPAFPAMYDLSLFAESYNEQLRRIRNAIGTLPEQYDVAAQLADYFVHALNDLGAGRKIGAEWATSVKWATWANVSSQGNESSDRMGARKRAFTQWCQRIPLLAAPESGLSPDAARMILDAIPLKDEQKELLRKVRRERVRAVGIHGEGEVTAELAAIDAQHEGHPWIRSFGAVT